MMPTVVGPGVGDWGRAATGSDKAIRSIQQLPTPNHHCAQR